MIDVLALRVGKERFVLSLSDVAQVISRPVITAVPSSVSAFLGVASSRGSVVAAYNLGMLLGRPPCIPRWLVVAANERSVGIAFDHVDGQQQIPRNAQGSGSVLLLQMTSLVEAITALAHPQDQPGDRS